MSHTGRFAPSPTGLLHFGSLLAATASYLEARSQQGRWLLRLEDLDKPRESKGASAAIIQTLKAYGFEWDGDILFQSQRLTAYQDALHQLKTHTYRCTCSRKQLQEDAQANNTNLIYTGRCLTKAIPEHQPAAIRLKVPSQKLKFHDAILGDYEQDLQQDIGDFVLRRADGIFAYQLAVVVDDAWQGITHIVRGADLLNNTPRQLYLQQLLGFNYPHYAHIPMATNAHGQKLSKQSYAPAIKPDDSIKQLVQALQFLGQNPPPSEYFSHLNTLWDWAIQHWQLNRVPKLISRPSP